MAAEGSGQAQRRAVAVDRSGLAVVAGDDDGGVALARWQRVVDVRHGMHELGPADLLTQVVVDLLQRHGGQKARREHG